MDSMGSMAGKFDIDTLRRVNDSEIDAQLCVAIEFVS